MDLPILREEIIAPLLTLAQDPIPNIRFNVGKCFEVIGTSFGKEGDGKEFVAQQVIPALEQQKNDQDADVRYYSTRALEKIFALA